MNISTGHYIPKKSSKCISAPETDVFLIESVSVTCIIKEYYNIYCNIFLRDTSYLPWYIIKHI